jgi:hypothetical protein
VSVSVCPICGGVPAEGSGRCGRPCLPRPGVAAQARESFDARAPIPQVLRGNRDGEAEAFVAAGHGGRRINHDRVDRR